MRKISARRDIFRRQPPGLVRLVDRVATGVGRAAVGDSSGSRTDAQCVAEPSSRSTAGDVAARCGRLDFGRGLRNNAPLSAGTASSPPPGAHHRPRHARGSFQIRKQMKGSSREVLRVNSTILRASYCIPRLQHRFTAMFTMSFALQLLISALAFADEIRIPASKDNTLYQSDQGSVSNARGQHFFVGTNRQANVRRGVIAFDIAGNIPEGSVICDTRLTLSVSASHLAIGTTIDLRAALSDWGEGTSLALGTEGRGANASVGDAT